LLAAHAISQEDADSMSTGEQSARAQLARGSHGGTRHRRKLNLDFTQVRSPIDGRVSNIRITPGNLVTS
jgi:multidrug efflux system membrane fusion protein